MILDDTCAANIRLTHGEAPPLSIFANPSGGSVPKLLNNYIAQINHRDNVMPNYVVEFLIHFVPFILILLYFTGRKLSTLNIYEVAFIVVYVWYNYNLVKNFFVKGTDRNEVDPWSSQHTYEEDILRERGYEGSPSSLDNSNRQRERDAALNSAANGNEDAGRFFVRIVDKEDRPISNAKVDVWYPGQIFGGCETRYTDGTGRCEFPTHGESYIESIICHESLTNPELAKGLEISDNRKFNFIVEYKATFW